MKLIVTLVLTLFSAKVLAVDASDPFAKEAMASIDISDQVDWVAALKKYYLMTEPQIKKYTDRGFSYPQIAIAAQIARASKKSIDDVWALRDGNQLGWPDVAKDLKINPDETVKEVAKIRKEIVAGKFAPKPRTLSKEDKKIIAEAKKLKAKEKKNAAAAAQKADAPKAK